MGIRGAVPVEFGFVFPHGVWAMSVSQAEDFNERTGRRSPSRDAETGEPVWNVSCIDRDPEARRKDVRVKVTSPTAPVLPGEFAPGTGLHPVEFEGMSAMAYVADGWVAWSYRARGMRPAGSGSPNGKPTAVPASAGKSS